MRYDDREMPFALSLCCHAVGLRYKRPFRRNGRMYYRPFRNHFDCVKGSREDAAFEQLMADGNAVRLETESGRHMYFLTRTGLDWLGEQLHVTILDLDRHRSPAAQGK